MARLDFDFLAWVGSGLSWSTGLKKRGGEGVNGGSFFFFLFSLQVAWYDEDEGMMDGYCLFGLFG